MPIKPKIYIDAGHGGADPGAVNLPRNLREADVCFEVSRILGEMLQHSCDILLSRPAINTIKTINERIIETRTWVADYYLSIHANAGGGTGAETFYFRDRAVQEVKSLLLLPKLLIQYMLI